MKKLFIPTALFVAAIIFLVGGYLWWGKNSRAVGTSDVGVRFVIPKGWSATQIGNSLYDKNLIKHPLAFKFYVQLTGKTRDMKPGEFTLSSNMNLISIIEKLMEGPDELWVTVPEGLRREEIVEEFIEDLEMDGTRASEFRDQFLSLSVDHEGYLFPDTYLFPRDVGATMVVNKMIDTFDEKVEGEISQGIDTSKYSKNQIITMASIIERESRENSERSTVAGILWKRLESEGWLLQADATVQYAVASLKCKRLSAECVDWWPILTRDDLEIDSPYNSYKFKPLPPTPIASPGLGSIEAAVFPTESSYWFYIHDPDGQIHFAKTLSEHNSNVRKYLGK